MVHATTSRPPIVVTADGRGVASHAGTRLLADVADAAGLSAAFEDASGHARQRRSGHRPGRVLADLAVMLADGGESISDLAVLRDQAGLFGPVASTATAWRVLDGIDEDALPRVRAARAAARERAWLLREEAGRPLNRHPAGQLAHLPGPPPRPRPGRGPHPLRQGQRTLLVRGQRRLRLKIADHWRWRNQLAAPFHRLQALPRPQRI